MENELFWQEITENEKRTKERALRSELRNALNVLKKFNDMSFYPNQKTNFTSQINEFSSLECNKMNEIIEKFQSKIKQWDFRGYQID